MDSPPLVFHVHSATTRNHVSRNDLRHVLAVAVINRLQEWCCQLLRLTILCVLGAMKEDEIISEGSQPSPASSKPRKDLAEIEMKMLRHLTSPLLRQRPIIRRQKRRPASRPPSPQLFDIAEEE